MKALALVSKNTASAIKKICDDIVKIVDCTKESKFDSNIHELKELMEMNECMGTLYFESTRRGNYLWAIHAEGPAVKLCVVDITHMRFFAGNGFRECGAVLLFTQDFDTGHLLSFKTVMEKVCASEKPKDRALCFYFHDDLVWMRWYNLETMGEIGPRLTLKVEKVLDGCLCGKVSYDARPKKEEE